MTHWTIQDNLSAKCMWLYAKYILTGRALSYNFQMWQTSCKAFLGGFHTLSNSNMHVHLSTFQRPPTTCAPLPGPTAFFFFFFFLPIWITSLHQQCRLVRSLFSNIFFRVKTIAETEEAMKAQNRAATGRWGGESSLVTHNQLKVCCENNLTSQQCSSDLVGLPVPWPSLQGIFQQLAFQGLTS